MIRRVVVVAAVVGFSLLVRAAPAVAQPEAGTVFVSLAGLAVIDDGPALTNFDRALAGNDAGPVAGGTLGVGVHLTPRVSFRAEWSTTAELRDETTATNILPLTSFTATVKRAGDEKPYELTFKPAPKEERKDDKDGECSLFEAEAKWMKLDDMLSVTTTIDLGGKERKVEWKDFNPKKYAHFEE